jgi:tRNA threonylcarbamoyladenosine biosynthesis protein TsaB
VLETNGVSGQDIHFAGAAAGPGSFTGLRIGLSFLKGFFLTRQVKILPVSSLEATALSVYAPGKNISVVFEARQNQVFFARFAAEESNVQRITDDTLMPAEQAAKSCAGDDMVLIDTLGFKSSLLTDIFSNQRNVRFVEKNPVARGLAVAVKAWKERESAGMLENPVDLLPRYMRDSAAQERLAGSRP